ncbi:MAG: prepilin peptidase [Roseburia sp.]
MIQKVVLLGALAAAAYKDYREQKVYVQGMLGVGMLGILLQIVYQSPALFDMLAGAAIGVGVLVLAWLTKESIGFGDGIAVVVSGIFLGFWKNLELILAALFLAGVAALLLLVIKKRGRKYRVAFLPFLAAAYLLQLL